MGDNTSLTPQEVADRLKVAKNTVYEMIKRGELPSYKVGRKIRIEASALDALKGTSFSGKVQTSVHHGLSSEDGFVISGQDVILDILAREMESPPYGFRSFRSHQGSYNGLYALYNGSVQAATCHLWDGDTGTYNIPYIRKMVPGMMVTVIHLVKRMQGFYVKEGNPLKIKSWKDLARSDVIFINREKGSGVRVLLDEHLRLDGIDCSSVKGYDEEVTTHLEAASAVSRHRNYVALGNEKTALQVPGIDFIPIQQENYDLVMLKKDSNLPYYRSVMEILKSKRFRDEVAGLGGYDVTDLGKILI